MSESLRAFSRQWFGGGAIALCVGILVPDCVGHRPESCSSQSDCKLGFCSANGFCEHECSRDNDCPCGAYCSTNCGICITLKGTGPATCFAINRGLSTEEILGACRTNPESADSAANCTQLTPVTVSECLAPSSLSHGQTAAGGSAGASGAAAGDTNSAGASGEAGTGGQTT
jgi:hypothetical protein